eukprot:768188-Hanusia_phi.AAC.1
MIRTRFKKPQRSSHGSDIPGRGVVVGGVLGFYGLGVGVEPMLLGCLIHTVSRSKRSSKLGYTSEA